MPAEKVQRWTYDLYCDCKDKIDLNECQFVQRLRENEGE